MARDYAKVTPDFWTGQTGREIRACGPAAQVVAMYLLTCRHANMIGVYYLSLLYITSDTGIGAKDAITALEALDRIGFAHFDPAAEMVYVPEFARYQIAESLKPGDKQVRGVVRELQKIAHPYANQFHAKYAETFCLPAMTQEAPFKPLPRGNATEIRAEKPLRSQEQEQEQDQEQEQELEHARPRVVPPVEALPPIQEALDVADSLLLQIRTHEPSWDWGRKPTETRNRAGQVAAAAMRTGVTAESLKNAAKWAHTSDPPSPHWRSVCLSMRGLVENLGEMRVKAKAEKARASPTKAVGPVRVTGDEHYEDGEQKL